MMIIGDGLRRASATASVTMHVASWLSGGLHRDRTGMMANDESNIAKTLSDIEPLRYSGPAARAVEREARAEEAEGRAEEAQGRKMGWLSGGLSILTIRDAKKLEIEELVALLVASQNQVQALEERIAGLEAALEALAASGLVEGEENSAEAPAQDEPDKPARARRATKPSKD